MEDLRKKLAEFLDTRMAYELDKYLIIFPKDMQVETYSCKDYYGIIFITEDGRYDVCNNFLMGERLIINPKAGGFKDIPFKPSTFGFLPEGVIASEKVNYDT